MGSELHAGPTVQMIFARRIVEAADDDPTARSASFCEDFPFLKFVPIGVRVGLIIVYGQSCDS
jgi:hypothetical protein